MRSPLLVPLLLVGALVAGCTTVEVTQPTLERELAAVKEQQRLDRVGRHVLRFREGLLTEAQGEFRPMIDQDEDKELAQRG